MFSIIIIYFTENVETKMDLDIEEPIEAANEVLNHPLSHTWVHFDNCELEKLKWTTDVRIPNRTLKPGESYEARYILLIFGEVHHVKNYKSNLCNIDLILMVLYLNTILRKINLENCIIMARNHIGLVIQ